MPVSRAAGRLVLEELEARILYSADTALLAGLPADAFITGGAQQYQMAPVVVPQSAAVAQPPAADETSVSLTTVAPMQPRHEIVFIDSGVEGAPEMARQFCGQQDASRTLDVYLLEAGSDGVAQIGAVLAGRHDVDAVHIISHGGDGVLRLGTSELDNASLPGHAMVISRWGEAMRSGADILLYGCDVARDGAGQAFVDALSLLTVADVAASSNATGSSARQADWTLEYSRGQIETVVAAGAALQQGFEGTLALDQAGSPAGSMAATDPASLTSPVSLVNQANPANLTDPADPTISGKHGNSVSEAAHVQASEFHTVTVQENTGEQGAQVAFNVSFSRQAGQAVLANTVRNTSQASSAEISTAEPVSPASAAPARQLSTGSTASFTRVAGVSQASQGVPTIQAVQSTRAGAMDMALAASRSMPAGSAGLTMAMDLAGNACDELSAGARTTAAMLDAGPGPGPGPGAPMGAWKMNLLQQAGIAGPGDALFSALHYRSAPDGESGDGRQPDQASVGEQEKGSDAAGSEVSVSQAGAAVAAGLGMLGPVWELGRKLVLLAGVLCGLPGWLWPGVRAESAAQKAREQGREEEERGGTVDEVEQLFDSGLS